jgi:ElaB/YqjD/DUF883 family membrane-anchored ribosome-binding protein
MKNMETDIYKSDQPKTGTMTPEDIKARAEHTYEQTKDTMSQAYDRTADALTGTYNQAMVYARENPGKTMLIAMGVGLSVGLVLAGSARRGSRIRRYGEPVVNALSDIALEVIRNL